MSTPAPDPAPFDPHAFPDDLVAAQRTAAELYARLHALQARLPWSREPHDGWPAEPERGRERPGRPATPGWSETDAAEFDRLREELRAATAVVQTHGWWERCKQEGVQGAARVAARMALKHAEGAVPVQGASLEQGDVRPAA
ncbi:hypothetical protein ACWEGS_28810 [Streptomyces sp. NPDC004822]